MVLVAIAYFTLVTQSSIDEHALRAGFKRMARRTPIPSTQVSASYIRNSDKAVLGVSATSHDTREDCLKTLARVDSMSSSRPSTKAPVLRSGKTIGERGHYSDVDHDGDILLGFIDKKLYVGIVVHYKGTRKDKRIVWDDANREADRKMVEAIGRQLIADQSIKP